MQTCSPPRVASRLFPCRAAAALLTVAFALLAPVIAHAARGGPDAGGWMWADSDEPGVTPFYETMTPPTTFASTWLDDAVYPITLSFPVTLYGVTSSTVYVSSNGWVSLRDPLGNSAPANNRIPGTGIPAPTIFHYWSDLVPGVGDIGIHGPTANGHVIFMIQTVKATNQKLQVVIQFYRNGSIKVLYIFGPNNAVATLGIDSGSGSAGTELLWNANPAPGFRLRDGYAVLYYPRSAPACATAPPLSCAASVNGDTTGGSSTAAPYGCSGTTFTGRERVYALTVPAIQTVTLSLTGNAGRRQSVMLLKPGCDAFFDCIGSGSPTLNLPLVAPGTYYVVVDGESPTDDGPFTLTTGCAAATTPITCGQSINASPGASNRIGTYSCAGAGYDAFEQIYEFSLAAPTTIFATLTPALPWDLFLLDAATLTPVSTPCRRRADSGLAEINLPAGNYAIIVDGPSTATSNFTLQLTCQATLAAVPIACGQSNVPGSSVGPSYIDRYSCAAANYTYGEAFYRFQPTTRVIATASTLSFMHDLFAFREADAPNRCAGFGDTTMRVANLKPEDHLFVMDSAFATGPTDLSLQCATMTTQNASCGATVPGVTGATSLLNGYSCIAKAMTGGESFFVYNNPVVQDSAFAISGFPTTMDLDVAVFDGPFDANQPQCLAGGNSVARIANAPPGEYLVVVDGTAGARGTAFDLTTVCGPPSATCTGAQDLVCNSKIPGSTLAAPSTSFLYGNVDGVFTGPERVYHFFNPVKQSVNFLLRGSTNPFLDLILLRGCDAGQVVDSGDDAIIQPSLDPGDYYLVVDGRSGQSGSYEIVTFCGGPYLDPPVLQATIPAGSCLTEIKALYYPTLVPVGDVMFSFDLSGSMGQELAQVKANARNIYSELNQLIPSLHFGLASLVEYAQSYVDTVCGVNHLPTAPGAYPFRVHQTLTPNIALVDSVLQTINLVGGAKETYTRSFYEAYTNPDIGWRTCSKRLWLNFGDELPVDCNAYQCIGQARNTGRDPGPDLITGTPDDLLLLPTIDQMNANAISLIHVDSSEDATQIAMWDCLARRTGGRAFITDQNAQVPDGTNIGEALVAVIKDTLRPCPEVRLVATGPYAPWVTITPASYLNIRTPFYGEFTIDFCIPAGIPPGTYPITIEAQCIGANSCALELLGTQSVVIEVPPGCPALPEAIPAVAPGAICVGDSVLLDGSASLACGAGGFQYQWRDGATILCPWSSTPTCAASPTTTTSYSLDVTCLGLPSGCGDSEPITVLVEPVPAPALDPLPDLCGGGLITLDASASSAPGCSVPLEYQFRDGATILQTWSTDSTYGPFPAGASTTYGVDVRCPGAVTCAASTQQPLTVVTPPLAEAGADVLVCLGTPVLLDASLSSTLSCPGGALYEWRQGATVVRAASPDPTYAPPVATPGTTVYEVIVRCATMPDCLASDLVTVTVVAPPVAVAGTDTSVCQMTPVTLDGRGSSTGSCPAGALYEWRQGATVLQPWSPISTWSPPVLLPGALTYTLVVRCLGLPTCESQDDVVVTIRSCTMAVEFERFSAVRRDDGRVAITWRTFSEQDTNFYMVQRALVENGDYANVAMADAHGPRVDYELLDEAAPPAALPWYRIVEYTSAGIGDQTAPFRATEAALGGTGTGTTPTGGGRRRGGIRKR